VTPSHQTPNDTHPHRQLAHLGLTLLRQEREILNKAAAFFIPESETL
jgi:hypothetical protein